MAKGLPQKPERLFGVDWATADDLGLASIGWRDKPGGRLKHGVEIRLNAGEDGLRFRVSRVAARRIAMAIAEASGLTFDRRPLLKPIGARLARELRKHTVIIDDSGDA